MGSRLVYDLAVALGQAGLRATRFDFRGVGRSEGTYDGGHGESLDAITVFDALTRETGLVPSVVGYSFGGAVACRLATARDPRPLVLVGCPLRLSETVLDPLTDATHTHCPTFVVVGDQDGFVPVADARRLAAAFTPPAGLTVLPGAAHFLEPSHNSRAVAAVLSALGRPPRGA